MRHGFGKISREDFGVDILSNGFGRFARKLFDHQPMLEDLEGFLNAPALVIQISKVGGRIVGAID